MAIRARVRGSLVAKIAAVMTRIMARIATYLFFMALGGVDISPKAVRIENRRKIGRKIAPRNLLCVLRFLGGTGRPKVAPREEEISFQFLLKHDIVLLNYKLYLIIKKTMVLGRF